MAFQSMHSMTPALWRMLRDVPDGPVAFLNGLWGNLAGAPLCYKTEPVALNGKTLTISVATLPWQHTLEKMSDLLIGRINGICGSSCVEKIQFQVSPVNQSAAGRQAESAFRRRTAERDIAWAEIEEAIRSMAAEYL